MDVHTQIDDYIDAQPERKRADMRTLHARVMALVPGLELWFLDGKDERGKTVTNPNIGYGRQKMTYADVHSRDFYQIGLSANTSGISVYIMGLPDKSYLASTYADKIGKATVTGYCIRFSKLANIDLGVLDAAIRDGIAQTSG